MIPVGRLALYQRLLLLALAATLTGCGFHLRGGVALAPVLEKVYLQSETPYSGISARLRNELQSSGAELVDAPEQATAVLQVLGSRSLRRVLSVGQAGRASEYELFEEVTFALETPDGEVLLSPQTLQLTRDMAFDETQLLGKVSEGEDIQRQMRRRLARQIITRITVGMTRQ